MLERTAPAGGLCDVECCQPDDVLIYTVDCELILPRGSCVEGDVQRSRDRVSMGQGGLLVAAQMGTGTPPMRGGILCSTASRIRGCI